MHTGWRLASVAVLATVVGVAALLHSPEPLLAAAAATASDPLLFGLVVLGLYVLRPLVLWPTALVAVVVGYGYGLVLGVPVALAGAALTSVPPFVLARWLGRDAPAIDGVQRSGERFFEATGAVRGVTAGRLAPVPADAVTCAAAVAGVRFRHLVAGILVGELPWSVAAVAAGASLATLRAGGVEAGGVRIVALSTLAAAALLAGPAYRRYGDRLDVRARPTNWRRQ